MGSRCDEALTRLYPYLDRELTWYRRLRVRFHLRRCPPCGNVYAFEDRLRTVIRQKCREEIPPEVIERLRQVVREQT
ncbi:MAG: zf-HC2 domain-containing protein [Acidimicrobiia bacterium]